MALANPISETGGSDAPILPDLEGWGLWIRLERMTGFTAPGLLDVPFFFQCPPMDEFRTSDAYSHSEFETVAHQQFSRPSARQLTQVTFNTLTLDWDPSWSMFSQDDYALFAHLDPITVKQQVRALNRSGSPFHMVAQDILGRHLDMNATLRSLDTTERAGEPDTLYFDMQFVEFKHPDLEARGGSRNDREKLPTTVTITELSESLSTLYGLARHFYHAPARWRVIAKTNGLVVSPSQDLRVCFRTDPLRKLQIPALPPI